MLEAGAANYIVYAVVFKGKYIRIFQNYIYTIASYKIDANIINFFRAAFSQGAVYNLCADI